MAESVNQRIADALTRRQIQASRVEAGLRREVIAQLAVLEADILAAIKANDPTELVLLSRRRREVEALMADEIDPLIQSRYARLAELLDAALLRLARSEAGAVADIINEITGEETVEAQPSAARVRAGVVQGLFPSAATPTDPSTTGRDWWQRAADSLSQRLGDTLMTAVALEESLTQMTRRVRGTSANAFNDGVMARARADAVRLLTTQTTNAVGEARVAVAGANASRLILQHVSVLDARTSLVCLGRNGLKYTADTHAPIGHDIPYLSGTPYHPHCRSVMTMLVADGGSVAQESTAQWLRRQGLAVQDEVLGPTRAQMFRAGTLSPRALIDSLSGTPLTLEELGA